MINDEMLEFIRGERAAGMGDAELGRLLITEGGWEQADVNEAFRALLPTPSSPVLPSETTAKVASIAPPAIARASSPAPAATFGEKHSQDGIRLDTIIPQVSSQGMLEKPKTSQNNFLGLLAQEHRGVTDGIVSAGSKETLSEATPASSLPNPPLATSAPLSVRTVFPSLSGVKQAEKKDLSIQSLLVGGSDTTAFSSKEVPASAATSITPASVEGAGVSPMKFNLDALRASAATFSQSPVQATPHARSDASPLTQPPALSTTAKEKMSFSEKLFHVGGAKKLAEFPSGAEDSPHISTKPSSPEGQKKKIEIIGRRTMVSDLLSRTGETAAQNSAPLPSTEKKQPPRNIDKGEGDVPPAPITPLSEIAPQETTISLAQSPFQDDAAHRIKTIRIVKIVLGAVILLVLVAGVVFAFLKFRPQNAEALLSSAFSQFLSTSSFAYKGQVAADLVTGAAEGDAPQDGGIKFTLEYGGTLGNGSDGYGDGLHKMAMVGGWKVGDAILATNVEADIRVIGNTLYVQFLSLPDDAGLDPALLKENWLKLDLSDIAQELRLSGVSVGFEEYGSFGGTSKEQSFNTLFGKTIPFNATGDPVKESLDGVATFRIHIVTDPGRMTELVRVLYQKYMNKDLTLSAEQRLRLNNALAKLSGDVWVNKEGGALVKISLSANFDDDIVTTHVKGPVVIDFSFTDFGTSVSVSAPTAILTLPELKVKLDEAQILKETRARDQVKITNLALLADALKNYFAEKGRYPKVLTDLYAGGTSVTSLADLLAGKEYFYKSYQKATVVTKAGECLTSGKVCAFFHLGVSLEDVTNEILKGDADKETAIFGADTLGCSGEKDAACYDVVSPVSEATNVPALPTTPTSTISPPDVVVPVDPAPQPFYPIKSPTPS